MNQTVEKTRVLERRLRRETGECFRVIDSCLRCYYDGDMHMHRPLAAQLRILFCDMRSRKGKDRALLSRAYNLKVNRLRPIAFFDPNSTELDEEVRAVAISHPADWEFKVAKMPFEITEYANGLQVADLLWDQSSDVLPLDEWVEQKVSVLPTELTVSQVIRSVADKSGGAHVDNEDDAELAAMRRFGPAGVGVNVLFIVALARYAQAVGFVLGKREKELQSQSWSLQESVKPGLRVDGFAGVPDALLQQSCNVYTAAAVVRLK